MNRFSSIRRHTSYLTTVKNLLLSLTFLSFSVAHVSAQRKLSPGDHYANVNGVKLHYVVAGKGPVCMFPSPGWGAHVDLYVKSLKPFEKHFTMVYYDTRKSGLSTGPDDYTKYTDQDLVNDMDSLRTYLGQNKVWLAGHSGGGYQVLNYGSQHNEHVNGIIALDAMALYDTLQFKEMMHTIETKKTAPAFAEAKQTFANIGKDKSLTPEEIVNRMLPLYYTDTIKMKLQPRLKVNEQVFMYTNRSNLFKSKNLLNDLHNIKVPVWVVVGSDDFICGPESEAKRIHERIPTSDLLIVDGVGHLPWVEKPEVFFAEFNKWTKKQGI